MLKKPSQADQMRAAVIAQDGATNPESRRKALEHYKMLYLACYNQPGDHEGKLHTLRYLETLENLITEYWKPKEGGEDLMVTRLLPLRPTYTRLELVSEIRRYSVSTAGRVRVMQYQTLGNPYRTVHAIYAAVGLGEDIETHQRFHAWLKTKDRSCQLILREVSPFAFESLL